MNLHSFLKGLTIFNLISQLASNIAGNPAPLVADAVSFANKEIDSLITKGHLPTDFKNDLGSLVTDIATIHPAVKNDAATAQAQ